MKCMKRIALESEWKEEDHPRDSDGIFVEKPALDAPSEMKSFRNEIFADYDEYYRGRINAKKKELDVTEKNIKEKDEKWLLNRKKRLEREIKEYEDSLDLMNKSKEFYDNPELIDIKYGTSTHKEGHQGFKSGITKNKAPFDFFPAPDKYTGHRGLTITPKNSGGKGMIPLSEYDEKMKGVTIIKNSVGKNAPDGVKDSVNRVMSVWNMLSDEDRDGVDVLKINYGSEKINKKHSVGGWKIRETLDLRDIGERDIMIQEPSHISVLLNEESDTEYDAIHTMVHEVTHRRYERMKKDKPDVVKKFHERVISLGRDGAPTAYAESKWDDLETVKSDNSDGSEQALKNIAMAEESISNEYHSEFISGLTTPWGIGWYSKPRMEKMNNINTILKETLYG